MTNEQVQTTLRFVGDWPWWAGVGGAALLGVAAWALYRRDVGRVAWWTRALLPSLRAVAVAMIVLMLSGPVLHHRKVIGQLSKLLLFVDSSRSMQLSDSSMPTGRKITLLQRMGLLPADIVKMDLPRASEALGEAQAAADKAKASTSSEESAFRQIVSDLSAKIGSARELIAASGAPADQLQRFGRELYDPAKEIAGREFKQINDRTRAAQDLSKLSETAQRWQDELSAAFEKFAAQQLSAEGSALRSAIQKFDTMPRAQRVQSILMEGGPQPLLAKLAETHDVQLLALDSSEAKKVWQPTAKNSALPSALPKPVGEVTNLATGVKASVGEDLKDQRTAAVVFTDGQHNDGESPIEVAKILGARQVPIFSVGIGSQVRPRDLALVKVESPDAVFYQDRVRGQLTLKDDMPAGMRFKVTIEDGDKTLWEKQLTSDGTQLRKVPFDFVVKEAVEARLAASKDTGVQVAGIPLELKVSVSQIEGDREPSNNTGSLRLRAVTQKRKVLVIDGRPRWESRYIRNLFDRDEQWEVNAVIAGSRVGEQGFARGSGSEEFPTDAAQLAAYDLIILGEVPKSLWKDDELKWISDFVAKRGGALVLIDGSRGRFKEYADTPLAPLFPVEWKGSDTRENIAKLALTERSSGLVAFSLAPDRAQNADLWSKLPPPRWIAGATPLPGAERLLDAEVAGQKVPAVVYRPFGAGKVLYHAFDESWRWRYEVADQHHVRYWNQIANWIAELPFAVRDKFISLDAGALTYRPGESADIRVRLRDGEGKPVSKATIAAALYRDGSKVATIPLAADDNAGGLFRGKTASLEPGTYEIGVEAAGIPDSELKARAGFKVEPRETGELTLLNLNEDLLRQVASASGGQYLREENAAKLIDLLAPMSQGRVIESDTVLWQSYWWFLPIIALFTAEWIIRKRVGLL